MSRLPFLASLVYLALAPQPASAAALDGSAMAWPWAIPFAGLLISIATGPLLFREANGFTWEPILEVAKLFAAIFVCIIPVLAMLRAGPQGSLAWLLAAVTEADGTPNDLAYFWLTGLPRPFSTTPRPISCSSSSPAATRGG